MSFSRKIYGQQSGFTLLELLLAVALIGLGMLALGTVTGNVMNKNSDSEKKTIAVNLAQEKLEDIKNQALAGPLTDDDGSTPETTLNGLGVAGSGIYTRTTVITGGGADSLATITVTVSWVDKVTRSVALATKISQ